MEREAAVTEHLRTPKIGTFSGDALDA